MFGHLNNRFDSDFEPNEFYLSPNYPNPFKEKTKIKYCVAYTTRVRLTVFDSKGNEIQKLVDEEKDPGTYEVEFSARHFCESLLDGKAVRNPKSEDYFYRLQAGDYRGEMKMKLINISSE
jgi:hypothetical protein